MKTFSALQTSDLKGDIYGGLTAAVVALPLALAFGVSSGAGPIAGLYGAIFVGFFAAMFGGTRSQISGSTGPMTVVMAGVLTASAGVGPGYAFTVVMLGGLFQILFGVLKLGRYIRLMPYSVVSGFMSGIGVIIILIQFNQLAGLRPSGDPVSALGDLHNVFAVFNGPVLFISALTLLIVFCTPPRINRLIPAPLIALFTGTIITAVFLSSSSIPVLGDIPQGWPEIQMPVVDASLAGAMIRDAMILALLGSIDSLLTSLVADNATNTQHDSDKELIGQGIGNTVSGLFGGLPGAGATMRTVVNIKAGGSSPISGMIHALVLLGVVAGAGTYASNIPHAVLAGILIKVGVDIIDWQAFVRIRTMPKPDLLIMLSVLFLTVLVDLITAVFVGLMMACLFLAKRLSDLQKDNTELMDKSTTVAKQIFTKADEQAFSLLEDVLYCKLKGPLSFAAARDMVASYQRHLDGQPVLLDLSDVTSADHSTMRALEDIVLFTREHQSPIAMYCNNHVLNQQLHSQFDGNIELDQMLFEHRQDAIHFLVGQQSQPALGRVSTNQ